MVDALLTSNETKTISGLYRLIKGQPDPKSGKGPTTITRRGKAVGVIISPAEYKNLRQARAYIQMINLSQRLRDGPKAGELNRFSRQDLEDRP
jgi:hypothetical protein